MAVRPQIDEETIEKVNEKVGPVMRVDPEEAGFDTKVNILLEELAKLDQQQWENRRQGNDTRRFGD